MLPPKDTIAALATPVGTAAIALVRVSGPDTSQLAAAVLGRPALPRHASHVDYRTTDGTLLDDVLLTFFQAPASYTGEDALEISCHGNPFIAQKLLEDLFARGCRPAEPGEFTQRAFLNGRMDLSQAEAVMDILHARSLRALASANEQLRGGLSRRINELIERLLAVLATVEAYIDFPDEDIPAPDRISLENEIDALAVATGRLLATNQYGKLLREGIKTILLGAPNVGKSSLLNCLVGHDRALVSAEPGTTRDYLEELVMVGPYCLRVIDTAGLNPSPSPLERQGMEKTLERAAEADLLLIVVDATAPSPAIPNEIEAWAKPEISLVVANKCDLLSDSTRVQNLHAGIPVVYASALTGAGIPELVNAIAGRAERFRGVIDDGDIAVSARHAASLSVACSMLKEAALKVRVFSAPELLASDLRIALSSFGEVVGRVDNERMLDELFASFCIGK